MTDPNMKEMAEMLRQGAKMLSTHCPECGAPLFQLKTGEIFCPHEKRKVKIVKDDEDQQKLELDASLEKILQSKLLLLQRRLDSSNDTTEIRDLTLTVNALLDALNKLRSERKP